MNKLYLQSIIDDVSFESMPVKWQNLDFIRFSDEKTLFDFQQEGLKNAIKVLWFYYKEKMVIKQNCIIITKLTGSKKNLIMI